MYPELLRLTTPDFLTGLFPREIILHSYGAVIVLGIAVIYFFMKSRVRKYGMSGDELSNLIFYTFISAFVGGKVFYYLQEPGKYLSKPGLMLDNLGAGFVFYGSLLFAVPTILFLIKKKNIDVRSFLDILAYVGPIIHSFGRVGCLLAGCCYGKPTGSDWGLVFSHPLTKAKPMDMALYPTQLMDIGVNLLILIIIAIIQKRQAFSGQLFLIYITIYGVGRSIVEVYRGDSARGFFFDLISHSQMIALVLILISSYFWMKWRKDPQL